MSMTYFIDWMEHELPLQGGNMLYFRRDTGWEGPASPPSPSRNMCSLLKANKRARVRGSREREQWGWGWMS